jgi:hypothetical protein
VTNPNKSKDFAQQNPPHFLFVISYFLFVLRPSPLEMGVAPTRSNKPPTAFILGERVKTLPFLKF